MPASWPSLKGQDSSSWPLAFLLLAALLGFLSYIFSPLLPLLFPPSSMLTEHFLGATTISRTVWSAVLFLLLFLPVLSLLRRACTSAPKATQPTTSQPSSPSSSTNEDWSQHQHLPALEVNFKPSRLCESSSSSNGHAEQPTVPSLRMRRRLKAGTQPLELLPSLLPLGKDTPEAQPPVSPAPQTPSPSLLRRGGAVAGAALMASVICSSPTSVGAFSKVVSPSGVPVADYFEPEHDGSLRMWLKPSGTILRNTGRLTRVLSSSKLALAKNAALQPSAYVGHTIVIEGHSRLITAYIGDINGDGDVADPGEAEVFLDEPLGASWLPGAGNAPYKIFEGFSVSVPAEAWRASKVAGQGNDVVQWASAARSVVLADDVWSTSDKADRVLLGPNALDVDGIYLGKTMVIGSESRAITHYNGHSRVATVSPAFSDIPRSGCKFKIVQVHAARVVTMPELQGSVLSVSPFSPTMRFQIHAAVSEPAVLPVDYTGHEITVTTGGVVETRLVLAHTPDGFVSVTALTTAASNVSTFVVHGARPTLKSGGRTGLQGYGAVMLDGHSSFLTFDSAVAPVRSKLKPALGELNSTTVFAPRNCSASQHECSMNDLLLDSNSDVSASNSLEKWSMTFLSVVRPEEDKGLVGTVAARNLASGTLAPPDQGTVYQPGTRYVKFGSAAGAVKDLYTGAHVRLMLLDGTRVDRVVVRYSLDRRAQLDQPVPLEMVPSKTRFFITTVEQTVSALALNSEVPVQRGALVGMQIDVAGEWRTILHHGARPYSSDADGRVVTLNAPLSHVPASGSTRYRIVGARRLLSLDSAKAHIDVGVGHGNSENMDEPPLVYESTVQDEQLHDVRVVSGGNGYVCGGAFDVDIGGSAWHVGTFACGESGSIVNVTLLKNAPTVYAGDDALNGALRYPSECNGKTKDTSRCSSKSQHSSVSDLVVLAGGSNYVPGHIRATSASSGSGFSASFSVDDTGAVVNYQIPDAEAHGTGYDEGTIVDLYFPGTSIRMTGSVTSVDVLEGGSGHKQGPLVVACEGGCVGKGLAGVCHVDAIGAVTRVVLTSHGEGYTQEDAPSLSCGYAGSVPLLIANVAGGAEFKVVVAHGLILAAGHTRQETSLKVSARVSRVAPGKGRTSGCNVGDELLGVGGGGRGLAVQVAEVSAGGEILKLNVQNSGSGYSSAPRLVSKSKSCRCALDDTFTGSMDACWRSEISQTVPVSADWQIQAVVVDGKRGVMHHYVGGLQARHRMSTVDIGQAADAHLDFATLGARRAAQAAEEHVSKLWKGDVAEVLVYQCSASGSSGSSGSLLGCTSPADLDRLGMYLANKFQLSWQAAAGLTEGIAGSLAGPDHAMSVVQGKAGAGSVPLLRSVQPRVAVGASAQTITVSGRYFGGPGDEGAVQVRVGNEPCVQLKLLPPLATTGVSALTNSTTTRLPASPGAVTLDESVAVCVVQSAPAAVVDVTVVAWGVTGVLTNAFRHGAPEIRSLRPAKVHSAAGSLLTIIGTNLDSPLPFSVKLESHVTMACVKVEIVSASEMRCTLPQLLRTGSRVVITVDDQGEESVVSGALLEVTNVPSFYSECPLQGGASSLCMTCCMRSCQRWELSPEGNNRARGGAYYDHCTDECSQRVCPSSTVAAATAATLQRG